MKRISENMFVFILSPVLYEILPSILQAAFPLPSLNIPIGVNMLEISIYTIMMIILMGIQAYLLAKRSEREINNILETLKKHQIQIQEIEWEVKTLKDTMLIFGIGIIIGIIYFIFNKKK